MNIIKYNNTILYIPNRYVNDNLLSRFNNKKYENDELTLIDNFNENDSVLELGSCLGYLAILVSRKVKKIVSVEANPELTESLNMTKINNKCNNLTFLNTIIDTSIGKREFYTYDLIVASSADRDDKMNPGNMHWWNKNILKYDVEKSTIENIELNNNIKFNSLLIDIEGGELRFLEQYSNFIKLNINKIVIELHGRFMKDKKYNEKCLNILKSAGFSIKNKINRSYYLNK